MTNLVKGERVKLSINGTIIGAIYLCNTNIGAPLFFLDEEYRNGKVGSWPGNYNDKAREQLIYLGFSLCERRCWCLSVDTTIIKDNVVNVVKKYTNQCPCGIHPQQCSFHKDS